MALKYELHNIWRLHRYCFCLFTDLQSEVPPAYVYESNVHFGNILVSLNEQRKQGLLCDISVIVQVRLASCLCFYHSLFHTY